jgi:O-antigen/teichoic acid export membrane protein
LRVTPDTPLEPRNQGRLFRGTAAYLLTSTVQRGVSFLLLPIFAIALSPTEFGQIGIVTTVAAAIGAVLGLGLETAIFRSLIRLRDQPDEARVFLNTVGAFGIVAPIVLAVVVAWPVGAIVEGSFAIPAVWVALAVLGAGITTSVTATCYAVLRAQERLRAYVLLGLVQLLLNVGLPIWFVLLMDGGVGGWFAASALGAAVVLVVGHLVSRHRYSTIFERRYLWAALAFGIPMIPHAMSHWGLALSDRIVLGSLAPTAEVGVYHVAYQFGLPIALIAAAMAQSAQPLYAEASKENPRTIDELRRLTTYQVLAIAVVALGVTLLGPPVIQLVLPATYAPAGGLIPWIALGTAFYGCYFLPMNAITLVEGRTRWVWVITAIAGAVNVILNLALIPRLGVAAAAINTCIGYAVLLVGVAAYARRISSRGPAYELRRTVAGLALIALPVSLLLVGPLGVVAELALRVGAILGVLVVLFALRLLPRSVFRLAWSAAPPLGVAGRKA